MDTQWFLGAAHEFLAGRGGEEEDQEDRQKLLLLLPGGVFHSTDLLLAWLDHLPAQLQRHPEWDVNCCGDGVGRTLLEYACLANHRRLAISLIQSQVQVAQVTQDAFRFAIAHGSCDLVHLLLAAPGLQWLAPQQRQDLLIWALCYAFGFPGKEAFRITHLLLNCCGGGSGDYRRLGMLMKALEAAPHLVETFVDLLAPHQLRDAHRLDPFMLENLQLVCLRRNLLPQATYLARSIPFREPHLRKLLALVSADGKEPPPAPPVSELRRVIEMRLEPYVPAS